MIQIRHVPDETHAELKARAARAGLSLSDYLLRELQRVAARPTAEELVARLRSRPSVDVSRQDIVAAVREAREQPMGPASGGRGRDGLDA